MIDLSRARHVLAASSRPRASAIVPMCVIMAPAMGAGLAMMEGGLMHTMLPIIFSPRAATAPHNADVTGKWAPRQRSGLYRVGGEFAIS